MLVSEYWEYFSLLFFTLSFTVIFAYWFLTSVKFDRTTEERERMQERFQEREKTKRIKAVSKMDFQSISTEVWNGIKDLINSIL